MARSKQIHYIQHTVNITQPDDAAQNWAEGVIQVDLNLSKRFGTTIRNGNQFRLVGYGSSLRGYQSSSDIDTGFAGVTALRMCPVTKNSVNAHQKLYTAWRRQKKLASVVGEFVRYDDFEVGWDPTQPLGVGRTSTILMEGITDTTPEQISLYGTSVAGASVTLESFYDNMSPIPAVSTTYTGAQIKTPKYEDKFPSYVELTMPTSFSASHQAVATPDEFSGGLATGEMTFLPSDNHLSHMTGTLYYFFKGIADRNTGANADQLKLVITLAYEGWSSIAPTTSSPKRLSKKSTTRRNKA